MKYIGFKHQRENKQNSDNPLYVVGIRWKLDRIFNIPFTIYDRDGKETGVGIKPF